MVGIGFSDSRREQGTGITNQSFIRFCRKLERRLCCMARRINSQQVLGILVSLVDHYEVNLYCGESGWFVALCLAALNLLTFIIYVLWYRRIPSLLCRYCYSKPKPQQQQNEDESKDHGTGKYVKEWEDHISKIKRWSRGDKLHVQNRHRARLFLQHENLKCSLCLCHRVTFCCLTRVITKPSSWGFLEEILLPWFS